MDDITYCASDCKHINCIRNKANIRNHNVLHSWCRPEDIPDCIIKSLECVDKEELLKALSYDRNQYQKGYSDRDSEIVRCKNCYYFDNEGITTRCYLDIKFSPEPDWFCADGKTINSD